MNAHDVISDFADGDLIDLSGIDAIEGGGNDAFTFIDGASFSGTAGELRYSETSGKLRGDTDGDSKAEIIIEVANLPDLNEFDLIL